MIFLGPGGTSGLGYDEAFKVLKVSGLTAFEVEFTYGVRMVNSEAEQLGAIAKKAGVRLSCHAPYYINLASDEPEKILASKERILDSCERAHHMGADHVVFHAGFYGKHDKTDVFNKVAEELVDLKKKIDRKSWKVQLAPELTGKFSQFGDIDELMRLKKDIGCSFTIDFSHWVARTNGKMKYDEMFDKLEGIKHVHGHFSGVEYGEKGEKRHLDTPAGVLREFLVAAKKSGLSLTVISESPDPIRDSKLALRILRSI